MTRMTYAYDAYRRMGSGDGPLFRGRFKALVIEADSYLLELVRYIHLNPVQAGLVRKPEQYAWSSHRAFPERGSSPDWLTKEEVLGRLGVNVDADPAVQARSL